MKKIIKFIIKYIMALIYCIYLFTFGIFFKNKRYIISQFFSLFNKRQKDEIEIKITETKLTDIISDENLNIKIIEPEILNGNVSLYEIIIISQLIKYYKPLNIFEIGTFDGRTTLNLAANSIENSKIFTLDLPKSELNKTKLPIIEGDKVHINKEFSGLRFKNNTYSRKIIQLYGDSATFDFSPYYSKIDFIFIDGSHSYEYVLNDSEVALKLLNKDRGIILWHDYGMNSVSKALNKLYLEDNKFKNLKHITETSLVYLVL